MVENNDEGDDAEFVAMREKLILELETSVRKMKDEMLENRGVEDDDDDNYISVVTNERSEQWYAEKWVASTKARDYWWLKENFRIYLRKGKIVILYKGGKISKN